MSTAILFPGQGAQSVGMGRLLAEGSDEARSLFERASAQLGYDLLELCVSGPKERLDATDHSQPALFVTSLAAIAWIREHQPQRLENVVATAGLSLGEYSALVFSGACDFDETLKVVQVRGQAMQQASEAVASGMLSVLGLAEDPLQQVCDQQRQDGEVLQIANLLCPGNIAVSGHQDACRRLETAAVEAGAMKVIPLAVAGAFHTPIMEPAVERLREALAQLPLREPSVPVIFNVDAEPHGDPDQIRQLLARQVVSRVLWEKSMRYLLAQEVQRCVEAGPANVLRGLMKRIHRKLPVESVDC